MSNAMPAFARRLSLVSVMTGTTLTATGADSSRARVASPANTARTWPEAGSCTLVAHRPSSPHAVVVTCVQAEPAAVYSTPSAAPAGEEPSAKRRTPETLVGLAPFWLAALTVIAETGWLKRAALARSVGQLRVELLARAGGLAAVAVAADALEAHQCAGRVAVALATAGLERHLALHGHAVQRELPADQPAPASPSRARRAAGW